MSLHNNGTAVPLCGPLIKPVLEKAHCAFDIKVDHIVELILDMVNSRLVLLEAVDMGASGTRRRKSDGVNATP